jgi:hypothetical protein
VNSAQFARRVVLLVNKNRTEDFFDFEDKLGSLVERHGPRIGVNRLVLGLKPPPKCRFPGVALTRLRVQDWREDASKVAKAADKGNIVKLDSLDKHFPAWFPEVVAAMDGYHAAVPSIREAENVAFRAILALPAFQLLCGDKANDGDKNYLAVYVIDQKDLVDEFYAHIFREVWNPNRDQFLRLRVEPVVAAALQNVVDTKRNVTLAMSRVRSVAAAVRAKLAGLLAEKE